MAQVILRVQLAAEPDAERRVEMGRKLMAKIPPTQPLHVELAQLLEDACSVVPWEQELRDFLVLNERTRAKATQKKSEEPSLEQLLDMDLDELKSVLGSLWTKDAFGKLQTAFSALRGDMMEREADAWESVRGQMLRPHKVPFWHTTPWSEEAGPYGPVPGVIQMLVLFGTARRGKKSQQRRQWQDWQDWH